MHRICEAFETYFTYAFKKVWTCKLHDDRDSDWNMSVQNNML